MVYSRIRRLRQIIIGQGIVAVIITITALSLLFYAQGYRLNLKDMSVIKTGILVLESLPAQANVFVDGKILKTKTPIGQSLHPGSYNVSVEKDGYMPWYKKVAVQPEFISSFNDIVLFKKEVKPFEITDQAKITLVNSNSDFTQRQDGKLIFNDYELWIDNTLVTRFSEPISNAIWYPGYGYIIFQQKNEIRAIDKDGQNNTLLITLSSNNPTRFVLGNKGQELYYFDNGSYKEAIIR